ncbi:MAG: hypothetical protein PSV16_14625 [Flavobacterium sp.]|nr:hypothetical protein [Flavobacterium sp.]
MQSNLLQQLLGRLRQFAMQLIDMPLKAAFKSALAESRLKKFVASETENPVPQDPPAQAPSPESTAVASASDQKSACWKAYLEKGGQWDYERWSKTYSDNMKRALQANIAVNQYHHEIGWGLKEVSIRIDGKKETLSIADIDAMRGIEVSQAKYTTRSKAAMKKIARHEALVKKGWDITWKIAGTASLPLLKELKRAGINITY